MLTVARKWRTEVRSVCVVEVAQVRADPLKIISLFRDLFFSFVRGPIS